MAAPWETPLPPDLARTDDCPSDEDLEALFGEIDSLAAMASKPLTPDLVRAYLDGDDLIGDGEWTAARRAAVPEEPRRFTINDDGAAEWVARKGAEAEAVVKATKEQGDEWIQRIKAWVEERDRKEKGTVAWATALLEDYALRQREASGGNRKTVGLPSAKISTRPVAAKIAVLAGKADEFVGWALEHAPSTLHHEARVSQFGGVIEIRPMVDRISVSVTMTCGHTADWIEVLDDPIDLTDNELVPSVEPGMIRECDECEEDPINGFPERAIETADVQAEMSLHAVFVADGTPAPGLIVEPPRVNPSVKFSTSG